MQSRLSVNVCHVALIWLLTCGATLPFAAQAEQDRPLRISANHRYLVDRDDAPFFMQGDAAWSLIANLSKEEASIYLRNRRAKGFNTVLVNLLEHKFSADPPRNVYGEAPFADMTDWSVPNQQYFEHADWVLREAAANDIVVLLAPIYLGYPDTDEGFIEEVKANGPEKLLYYGKYLGQRYRDFDNIIWVMGGDRNPGEVRENVNAVALGIREHDKRHLFTAHCLKECAPTQEYPGPWLDISNSYSYKIVHEAVIQDYNRVPVRPTFLMESSYEGERNASEVQIRRQAYWAALLGGFGHVMGNRPIWLFDPGWQAAMDAPGSIGAMHWGNLFRSRRWFDLAPDQKHQVVTTGIGEFFGLDYLAAARTSDGETVIAYMPSVRTITVDMSQISGEKAVARWFNPRTGKTTAIGQFSTSGARQFTPSQAGDWVLVLDDAARNLPPPGRP